MKFNANDILTSATNEFGGGVLGDESLDLVEDCIEIAHQWSLECADGHADGKTRHQLRRELKKYVRKRIDLKRHKGSSYIPSFIWQWLAQTIINWIVRRIIDSIIS